MRHSGVNSSLQSPATAKLKCGGYQLGKSNDKGKKHVAFAGQVK